MKKLIMTFMIYSLLSTINPMTSYSMTFEQKLNIELSQVDLKGIPEDYLKTVAVLETGHGTGNIYKHTKNLFSIKYSYNTSPYVPRYLDCKIYKFEIDSIKDVVTILTTQSRYTVVYEMALLKDAEGFFKELAQAGYAEDPNYAQKLKRVYAGLNK